MGNGRGDDSLWHFLCILVTNIPFPIKACYCMLHTPNFSVYVLIALL